MSLFRWNRGGLVNASVCFPCFCNGCLCVPCGPASCLNIRMRQKSISCLARFYLADRFSSAAQGSYNFSLSWTLPWPRSSPNCDIITDIPTACCGLLSRARGCSINTVVIQELSQDDLCKMFNAPKQKKVLSWFLERTLLFWGHPQIQRILKLYDWFKRYVN